MFLETFETYTFWIEEPSLVIFFKFISVFSSMLRSYIFVERKVLKSARDISKAEFFKRLKYSENAE